jgi:hypothetical protein
LHFHAKFFSQPVHTLPLIVHVLPKVTKEPIGFPLEPLKLRINCW